MHLMNTVQLYIWPCCREVCCDVWGGEVKEMQLGARAWYLGSALLLHTASSLRCYTDLEATKVSSLTILSVLLMQ
jgi:hypothetical protein